MGRNFDCAIREPHPVGNRILETVPWPIDPKENFEFLRISDFFKLREYCIREKHWINVQDCYVGSKGQLWWSNGESCMAKDRFSDLVFFWLFFRRNYPWPCFRTDISRVVSSRDTKLDRSIYSSCLKHPRTRYSLNCTNVSWHGGRGSPAKSWRNAQSKNWPSLADSGGNVWG